MPNDFTEQLIKEFPANVGQFDGARLLLLAHLDREEAELLPYL